MLSGLFEVVSQRSVWQKLSSFLAPKWVMKRLLAKGNETSGHLMRNKCAHSALFWLTLVYASSGCADRKPEVSNAPPGDSKADQERMQGTWVLDRLEGEGKITVPNSVTIWIFKESNVINVRDGKTTIEASFILNAQQTPRRIDIRISMADTDEKAPPDRKFAGRTTRGIYCFEGEILKLALGATGGDRPDAFSCRNSGDRVLYLKRIK